MVDHESVVARCTAARGDPTLAVLEGFHALKHAVRFGARIEGAWAVAPAEVTALADALAPDVTGRLAALVEPLAAETFARMVPRGSIGNVVAVARRPERSALDRSAPVVLLDSPAHQGNVGAVVRVAAAAGAAGVLATGRQDPWHPAALRGSAGLHFALPVMRVEEPPAGRPLVALDPDGAPLAAGAIPGNAVLAFGSERRGLGAELRARADLTLAIPMREGVSSLNLATAVAVALYAWRLGRRLAEAPVRATLEP
jgi:RNA methyltransferase, TrmH family